MCVIRQKFLGKGNTLVMIDEFNAFNADAEWIPSKVNGSRLDTFIAVEPSSWSKFDNNRKTKDSEPMIKLLPTKHRSAKLIDQFVTGAIKDKGGFKNKSKNQAPLKMYHHLEGTIRLRSTSTPGICTIRCHLRLQRRCMY